MLHKSVPAGSWSQCKAKRGEGGFLSSFVLCHSAFDGRNTRLAYQVGSPFSAPIQAWLRRISLVNCRAVFSLKTFIDSFGAFGPWMLLALFLGSSFLLIWRLEH